MEKSPVATLEGKGATQVRGGKKRLRQKMKQQSLAYLTKQQMFWGLKQELVDYSPR